jgi:hypothetical protein
MGEVRTTAWPYVWSWTWRTVGPPRVRVPWFADGVDRAGQRCRVLARGTRNSALLEFEDGFRVVTSRGGLRRAVPRAGVTPG